MVRHSDPGVPSWMLDSEEESLTAGENRDRTISFTTSTSETVIRTFNVSHEVTMGTLIDNGYFNDDDEPTNRDIDDAISNYISDGMIDEYDDDDPYISDSEYYDSDWDISDYGSNQIVDTAYWFVGSIITYFKIVGWTVVAFFAYLLFDELFGEQERRQQVASQRASQGARYSSYLVS